MLLKSRSQIAGRRSSAAVAVAFAALLLAPPAAATPWWVAWEGNDFPENEGWERTIYGEPAQRTLDNGVMTLDSLATAGGWDAYQLFLGGNLDPGPGELFIMRWRLRVEAIEGGNWDPTVYIMSDDAWIISFHYSMNRLWSTFENVLLSFAPGVFHSWELRSANMRQYELYLDGGLVRQGQFGQAVVPSRLGWGDGGGLERSRSAWDYVHVGTLPEPGCVAALVIVGICAAGVRRG